MAVPGLKVDAHALLSLPESEREAVQAELAVLERVVKENPLWALRPHAKQAEFMRPPHPRARCFFGGNRAGKTTAGMGYGLLQCVDRDVVPEHLLPFKRWDPPCYGRVVVPDLTRTIDGVILQKVREWCPGSQLRGGNVDRAFEKVQVLLRFKNGSWIQFMSNDQELNKFGGTALHWVLYDEEPRADIRREGLMRLIDYGGEELFTMTPLEGMCVDVETQCLTKRGWKFHDELEIGEPILTYDVDAGVTEWAPLQAIYRDEGYEGPMLRTPGHLDSMFTPDHKWVTAKRGLVPWSELKKTDRVVLTGEHLNLNADWLDRDFLELVGWVLAEGSVVPNENKIVIYQSASRYPEYCATILRLLHSVDAQFHQADNPYSYGPGGVTTTGTIRRFVITGDVARRLRWIIGWPKRLSPEFVGGLSETGLRALLKGLLDGDGHYLPSGLWTFTSSDRALADAVSMIGVLLGYRTNLRHFQSRNKTVWRVSTNNRSEISEFRRRAVETPAPMHGVWCPKTSNGTWVARRNGTAFITGNSWMYDEFFEPWERGQFEDDDIRVVIVDMDDNPHLSEEGKAIALAGLSGEEREARKSGRFVSFAGLIYPMFSTSRHVLPDEDQLPENVEVFEGLDPGLRVMAAVVFCYLDSEDRLVVFDELALQGQTVAEVAKAIKLVRERWGVTPRFTIIDPAARNKSSQTGRSDQQEYMDHGIVTILGQNEVRAGINRVRERLDADKLLVGARCSELRSEFKKYRWSKDSKRTEDDPRDKPVKKDDHLLDALRYVVMQRPLAPKDSLSPQTASFKDRLLRKSLEALSRNSRTYADTGFGPGQYC